MTDIPLFIFGLFVTLLAVGPLLYAALLDVKDEED
jgi:hypothetical protein